MSAKRFSDGDWTVPRACGPIRNFRPFPFQPETQVFRQRFTQFAPMIPLPISTPIRPLADTIVAPIGTWTLSFKGVSTAAIPALATAAQVQAAIIALSTVGGAGATCTVTGDWDNGYIITFSGLGGVHPPMKGNPAGITPGFLLNVTDASTGGFRPFHAQRVLLSPINTSAYHSAYLTDETEPQDVGDGVVEWDREYSNVPQSWGELQAYNYQKQRIDYIRVTVPAGVDGFGRVQYRQLTFIDIVEFPEPLTANVVYTYCFGKDLGKKKNPIYIPYRVIHGRDSLGNEFAFQVGAYGVAEPTSAKRWRGDIWEVKNVFVKPY